MSKIRQVVEQNDLLFIQTLPKTALSAIVVSEIGLKQFSQKLCDMDNYSIKTKRFNHFIGVALLDGHIKIINRRRVHEYLIMVPNMGK